MSKPRKLNYIKELKGTIVSEYRRHLLESQATGTSEELSGTSSVPITEADFAMIYTARPEERLSVGVGLSDNGEYRLSLGAERVDGPAYRKALQIKDKYEDVDVNVAGRSSSPKRAPDTKSPRTKTITEMIRPLQIGVSIGCSQTGAGTLGAFVWTKARKTSKKALGILSSTSVLAYGEDPSFRDWVYQPGRPDAKILTPNLRIGKVAESVMISRFVANTLDVALAELVESCAKDIAGNIIPQGCPDEGDAITEVGDVYDDGLGQEVAKIGRTTGYTEGIVSAVSIYGLAVHRGREIVLFDDIIEIQSTISNAAFSGSGDSGALVYTKKSKIAIGLLFASGETDKGRVSYACRLDKSLQFMDCKLFV